MLEDIHDLQKNFFRYKYTELNQKGILLTIVPEKLILPPNYESIIEKYKEKYDKFALEEQIGYFYNLRMKNISSINGIPICYSEIKCDITEKILSDKEIIEYYRYNNMDICREVYEAHNLNNTDIHPKLIRFNKYLDCENCRNIVFKNGEITGNYSSNKTLCTTIAKTGITDKNIACSSSSSTMSTCDIADDSGMDMLRISGSSNSQSDICNRKQYHFSPSLINRLYQLERTSYKAKFNNENNEYNENNHDCISVTKYIKNLAYPCDVCEFGSFLDWIPIICKKQTYRLILLNCNPDSVYYGKIAIEEASDKKQPYGSNFECIRVV